MNDTDKITIMMLNNIIKNIEAGNITTKDRSGEEIGDQTAEIKLIIFGEPDLTL